MQFKNTQIFTTIPEVCFAFKQVRANNLKNIQNITITFMGRDTFTPTLTINPEPNKQKFLKQALVHSITYG